MTTITLTVGALRYYGRTYTTEIEKMKNIELRDYFAGLAMQGELANYYCKESNDEIAEAAYEIADAMLEARKASTND